jgi:hypothetical protein
VASHLSLATRAFNHSLLLAFTLTDSNKSLLLHLATSFREKSDAHRSFPQWALVSRDSRLEGALFQLSTSCPLLLLSNPRVAPRLPRTDPLQEVDSAAAVEPAG